MHSPGILLQHPWVYMPAGSPETEGTEQWVSASQAGWDIGAVCLILCFQQKGQRTW